MAKRSRRRVAADRRAPAAILDVARHRGDRPGDELQRLVDQVRPPVEEDTAPRRRVAAPAARGAIVQHSGREEKRLAEPPGIEPAAHGQVVAIPAAVLEDAQEGAVAITRGEHLIRLGGGQAHHLVDNDVLPRIQRPAGEVAVGVMRRGDHHEVDRALFEHRIERVVGRHAVIGLGLRAPRGVARGDRDEL